jgi:Fe-S-cluster formation regulator IscX/YfhJ
VLIIREYYNLSPTIHPKEIRFTGGFSEICAHS